MAAKFIHQLFGAFIVFLVLQAFVVNSRPVKPVFLDKLEHGQKGGGCDYEETHSNNHTSSSKFHMVNHYTLFNGRPKWNNFPVTWGFRSISSLPAGLDSQAVNDAMVAAFGKWEAVVPKLAFQRVESGDEANIKIAFTPTQGTYYGFGYAPDDGRLDLDNNHTNWSTGSNPASDQLDLQSGAMHEIGHTLGLDHSTFLDAVMYPTLIYGTIKRDLSQDDIDGIRNLYA